MSGGSGVNALDHVVGGYRKSDRSDYGLGVQWETFDTWSELGTLGGSSTGVTAINDADQTVGYSWLSDDYLTHAFLFENGTMKDLGVPDPSFASSEAWDINNSGQVVGVTGKYPHFALQLITFGRSSDDRAFVYADGSMKNLGEAFRKYVPPDAAMGYSIAYGISDRGHVVGQFKNGPQTYSAFLYFRGQVTLITTYFTPDLFSSPATAGRSVNSSGVVVGETRGFASMYSQGALYDLNELVVEGDNAGGLKLTSASDINDEGEIVGWGYVPENGLLKGFLLRPRIGESLRPVATPQIQPGTRDFRGSTAVRVSCATSGATIRFSYGAPVTENSPIWRPSTKFKNSTLLNFRAFKKNMAPSPTAMITLTKLPSKNSQPGSGTGTSSDSM